MVGDNKLNIFLMFVLDNGVINVPFNFFEVEVVSLIAFNVPNKNLVKIFRLIHRVGDDSLIYLIFCVIFVPLSAEIIEFKVVHKKLKFAKVAIDNGD